MADLGSNSSKSVISNKTPGKSQVAGNTDKSFRDKSAPRADKFAYKRKGPVKPGSGHTA